MLEEGPQEASFVGFFFFGRVGIGVGVGGHPRCRYFLEFLGSEGCLFRCPCACGRGFGGEVFGGEEVEVEVDVVEVDDDWGAKGSPWDVDLEGTDGAVYELEWELEVVKGVGSEGDVVHCQSRPPCCFSFVCLCVCVCVQGGETCDASCTVCMDASNMQTNGWNPYRSTG